MGEGSKERGAFEVEDDIERAHTLPAEVYADPSYFELARERVFARSWQFVTDLDHLKTPGQLFPWTMLEGCLDEPLLLTRDADERLHCLSNVCTHRGNLVVESEGRAQVLRCRYHGRHFGLDGRFRSMPEFEGAIDFPSESDNLPRVPLGRWEKLVFASLAPAFPWEELIGPVRDRLGWLPLTEFLFDAASSRDYLLRANWALYCDNYLEGFHIPYVHPELARTLDYSAYRTEVYAYSSLQLGIAASGEEAFDLPAASPDYGQRIAAYYFWLFPNTMLNFYPWGLSINVVTPLAADRMRVAFRSYVWDPAGVGRGAGGALDRVERQDEDIVEQVQKGVRSRLYRRGRYSPEREIGVHHFHRLLAGLLQQSQP